MDIQLLKKLLFEYYDDVKELKINKHIILKGTKLYKKTPYHIAYFDLSNNILESDIDKYCTDIISNDYYKTPGTLQWNYYFIFIRTDKINNAIKNNIESNESYARKYVFLESELKDWLENLFKLQIQSKKEIQKNLSSIWTEILKKNKLDCIFSKKISLPKGIDGIISGEYKIDKPEDMADFNDINEDYLFTDHIEYLKIDKFREYPIEKKFNFGNVNLIEGKNGTGKTSLLEAIEFFLCGNNFREKNNNNSTKNEIKLKYHNKLKEDVLISDPSKLRYRDQIWYNNYSYQRGNKLCESFNKYNFYNSDAAFRISNLDNDDIYNALEEIIIDPEINYLYNQINNYIRELNSKIKIIDSKIEDNKMEIEDNKKILKEIQLVDLTPDKLKDNLNQELNKLNWKKEYIQKISDDISKYEVDFIKIQKFLNDIFNSNVGLENVNLNLIKDQENIINSKIISYNENMKKIVELNNLIEIDTKEYDKLNNILNILNCINPYFTTNAFKILPGLNNKILLLKEKVSLFKRANDLFKDIEISQFDKINKNIDDYQIEINNTLISINQQLTDKNKKIYDIEYKFNQIDNILNTIKVQGKLYLDIKPDALICPLCNKKYSNSKDLKDMIEISDSELLKTGTLKDLKNQVQLLLKKKSELQEIIKQIGLILNVQDILKKQYQFDKLCLKETMKIFNNINSVYNTNKIRLEDLQKEKEDYKNNKQTEKEYNTLIEELHSCSIKIEKFNIDILTKDYTKKYNRLKEDIIRNKDKKTQYKKVIFNLINQPTIDTEKGIIDYLNDKKNLLNKMLNSIKNLKNYFQFSDDSDITIINSKFEIVNDIFTKLKQEIKTKNQNDIIFNKCKTKIKKLQDNIQKENNKFSRINEILNLLRNEILTKNSKEKYIEKFINKNKKEIFCIFRQIHSPKEFIELNFNPELKKIELKRENGEPASLTSISSGQRAALTISIFLILNKQITNGPKLLILDDPVSFIDDLNVLAFLDYLREYQKIAERQIFIATANENLSFLLKKKFEFLGNDFKHIYLNRYE